MGTIILCLSPKSKNPVGAEREDIWDFLRNMMVVILKNDVTVFHRQRRLRMITIPDRDLSDAFC